MLSSREEKRIRALQRRKNREETGLFLVEGVRSMEDLLASELEVELIVAASPVQDTDRGAAVLRSARSRGADLRTVSDAELARLAATDTPQGLLAVARAPAHRLEVLTGGEARTILVLDAIQDPGNFGTLVRSAEALGAGGVISLPGTVDTWNPKAVRAAMGASFRLPIVAAAWPEAAGALRDAGFSILASAAGAPPLERAPLRSALIVGNEGFGISDDVLAGADAAVGIPLRGRAESLNVAAAAAILLYELNR